jgi:PPK2 family polyphosphate:nucleotide phosphotransferase
MKKQPHIRTVPMKELLRAGADIDLATIVPNATPGFAGDKKAGEKALAAGTDTFAQLQEKLFAAGKFGDNRSVLLVLQAMDTAGKGGIVKHVVGSVDPQGTHIHAFKAPTDEEKKHDFLWRVRRELPVAGILGVFDRSHYEDVLIHRVRGFSTPEAIEERYGIITEFEDEVVASGVTMVKVMLHISAAEQKSRLAARLADPAKHWKYNPGDIDERELWPQYMEAYQIALRRTSTSTAPWYVVPADHKWYARLAVQHLVIDALAGLKQEWPKATFDVKAEQRRLAVS